MRRRYMRSERENSVEYRWDLFDRELGVTFWFIRYTSRPCSICAGIESHYMCHEDHETCRCDLSPTGWCKPSGSSLAGDDLYHRAVFGPRIDEDAIWDELQRWHDSRSRRAAAGTDQEEDDDD